MTRTERSTFKNAVIRDRSESKNGFDKSDRKGGSGAHNWGSLTDEQELEYSARLDNDMEGVEPDEEEERKLGDSVVNNMRTQTDGSLNETKERTLSFGVSEEEKQEAREFRAKALKQGADLNAIARSSAGASTSPPGRISTVTVTTDAQTGAVP